MHDRILIVENDPIIADLVGQQALQGAGFQVSVVTSVNDAIARANQEGPDLIIADLNLPGLSGKDLLVAFSANGVTAPVIILAQKGSEAALVHTFRLGAADYLIWPVRETEVIAAVERQLKQVRERRERDKLARQLQITNQELQTHVRELTTIFSIGKSVTTVIEQKALFEKILEGAISVTQADLGWFLTRDEDNKSFLLASHHNLPASLTAQNYQMLDDGISSLVAMSGEPLAIHGEPLRRFKISSLGASALIVPIKAQKQVVGLLVMMRKAVRAFSPSEQHLLQAVADYACISLVNARLFRAVEEKARSLQTTIDSTEVTTKASSETLRVVKKELGGQIEQASAILDRLMSEPGWWSNEQKQMLTGLSEQLGAIKGISEAIQPDGPEQSSELSEILQHAIARVQPAATRRKVSIRANQPNEKYFLTGKCEAVAQVMDALLTNAIKYSPTGGSVSVLLEKTQSQEAHLVVRDTGPGIEQRLAERIFQAHPAGKHEKSRPSVFGGIGISLPLAHEMVTALNGRIWVESKPGKGASFHLTLPLA